MTAPFNHLFKGSIPPNTLWSIGNEKFYTQPIGSKMSISTQTAESLKKYNLIVADYSSEHWGPHYQGILPPSYFDLLALNLNFIFLTHHEPEHLLSPNYLYFPHHYFKKIDELVPQYDSVSRIDKKFKISCLNRNARVHRIYNFLKLKEKSYFNELLFTFHNNFAFRHDDPKLNQSMIDEWKSIQHNFSSLGVSLDHHIHPFNSHPAYTDSYIHLITETTIIPKIFITEKTWKSIASGQLFILLGNPGSVQHLRNLGVDTFDDYINHDYYDNESDWQTRIDKIHELVDYFMSLSNTALEQINKETQVRRLSNMEKYFASEFVSKYVKCFQDKVDELSIR